MPPRIECLDDETGGWNECSKSEVCSKNLAKDHYRFDKSQDEYIDNWVEQYDLLCEPKWRIGLLGSVYFAGILTTILIVPILTDKCGRKYNAVINNFLLIIVVIGIILASDITTLYVLLFLAGATFGGRLIAGLNWLVEYMPTRYKETVMFIKMLSGSFTIILLTVFFQFGTKHYVIIAWTSVSLAFIGTSYTLIFVPESAQWLHGRLDFDSSRSSLTSVAHQNGVYEVGKTNAPYEKFKFIKELELDQQDIRVIEQGLEISLESRSLDKETDRNSAIEEFVHIEYDKLAYE